MHSTETDFDRWRTLKNVFNEAIELAPDRHARARTRRLDRFSQSNRRLRRKLRLGAYTSIELNTSSIVPERKNQRVTIMGEDDALMTEKGFEFIRPR